MQRQAYDAIVLAGGTGSRLGGVDKAAVDIAGRSLLDRSLDIVSAATSVVVVGDRRPTRHTVLWVREQPPGGGPVAAVAAALPHVRADAVVGLACDMPLVRPATPGRLVAALGEADAALLVDAYGNRQPLAAAYKTLALRAAAEALADPAGIPMRRLVDGLAIVEVAAGAEEALDCDSWPDVVRSRRLLGGS